MDLFSCVLVIWSMASIFVENPAWMFLLFHVRWCAVPGPSPYGEADFTSVKGGGCSSVPCENTLHPLKLLSGLWGDNLDACKKHPVPQNRKFCFYIHLSLFRLQDFREKKNDPTSSNLSFTGDNSISLPGLWQGSCYRLNSLPPPQSICWSPTPNGMVFADGPLGGDSV